MLNKHIGIPRMARTSGLILMVGCWTATATWEQRTAADSPEPASSDAGSRETLAQSVSIEPPVSPFRKGGSFASDSAVVGDMSPSEAVTPYDSAYDFGSSPVVGPTIIPMSQSRFTNTVVAFPQCNTVSDGDQAVGFEPFDSFVLAALNCAGPYADMSANQQSQIDATSMTASGGLFFKLTGFEGSPVSLMAGADSVFDVTFELPSASAFELGGMISADGFGPARAFGTHTVVTLTGPGGQTIFTHLISVAPGGKHVTENLADAGPLKPGLYTLRAEAGAGIDGIVPSSGVGSAAFNFTFDVQEMTGAVPTVSQWGMLTMTLLLLTAGTLMFGLRRCGDTRLFPPTMRTAAARLIMAVGLWAAATAMGQTTERCPAPIFDNPEYPVGQGPFSAASGDLDGDGDTDLVTANFHEGTVSVLLNNGDGSFADDVKYEAGFEPASVAIGDLDDDGDLDLVVSSGGGSDLGGKLPGTVSVLLNPGDGTFRDQTIHGLGIRPFSVALGDLDGDDDLDMAVAVRGSDTVSIGFNAGDGTFVFGANIPAGDFPGFIVIGDLNGDGDLDLAVTHWTENLVSVFLNEGGGSFADRVTYSAGVGPLASAIGDLDGDGDPDLAVANLGPNDNLGTTVSVLLNNGDGTFPSLVTYGVGLPPSSVTIADLDADGDPDLAVTNLFDDDVSVLLNDGDAAFADHVTYAVGNGPASLAAGDFDGDADLDLAVANQFGNTLSILPNLGNGTFRDVESFVLEQPRSAAAGDLDGDGDSDLVVTSAATAHPGVSVRFNDGEGSFADELPLEAGVSPGAVAIHDLDGDGDLDLAVVNELQASVSILLNNGGGTFARHVTYGVGLEPIGMDVGDLDADGAADLVVANALSGNISVLFNNGDGTFADDVTFEVGGGAFAAPYAVALGDVDGDGDLDLASGNIKGFNLSVLWNNGDGMFTDEVIYSFFAPWTLGFADLDGDKDLDLVSANFFLWVQLNDGDGVFGEPVIYESGFGTCCVTTADSDGDGDLDLVVTNSAAYTVQVFFNDGDATFPESATFRVGAGPRSAAVGDFNADGAPDLAVVNALSDTVSVLLNRSTIRTGDPDHDGDVDLFDFEAFLVCAGEPFIPSSEPCRCAFDFDLDGDVDFSDSATFQRVVTGN